MKVLVLAFVFCAASVSMGCARVRVEAPKEPIKVDVSMRLDIYQHVAKDIDNIESIVSGAGQKSGAADKSSFLSPFALDTAWAQEQLSPEVEAAALRRRDRFQSLQSLEQSGVVGENRLGLVEVRSPSNASNDTYALVKAENADRMSIYQAISKTNNLALEEVEKLYAQRLQTSALSGTPIEVLDQAKGDFIWKTK